ncbi:DMT family transporter [Limnochorda pilosa]|uniref:EamA domain-containing protein n=1 Tax=Limnochorda pilosa TaxID=1555112 RepID=A0A0K2SNQ3_LIMPI|nr:DMT family transporter [Limnochorda pilosa]BAS28637.1 hypothetical protein LIP_2808 [Limnochorda pilosa]
MSRPLRLLAPRSPALTADLLLLGVTVIWGGTFPVIKTLVGEVPPHTLLALRFGAASLLLLLPALWVRPGALRSDPSCLLRDGVLLGVSLWAAYFLQTAGLRFTTASKAAFLTALSVVFVPILGTLVFKRRPSFPQWAGVGAATAGLALLSLPDGGGLAPRYGDVLVLLCAVAYAVQILLVDRLGPRHDPLLLTGVELATVAILSLGFAVGTEGLPLVHRSGLWWGLAYLAVPATAVALWIQVRYQHRTDPTRVGVILSMEPVFAALFAMAFLAERMAGQALWGAGLVLVGVLVNEVGGRRSEGSGARSPLGRGVDGPFGRGEAPQDAPDPARADPGAPSHPPKRGRCGGL